MKTILFLAFCAIISFTTTTTNHSQQWIRSTNSQPKSTDTHTFTISLKQKNLESLELLLYDISDPDSQNYGNFLTASEIKEIVSPGAQAIDDVLRWVNRSSNKPSCDLTHKVTTHGDSIEVTTCLDRISSLFNNKISFSHYTHPRFPKTKINRSSDLFNFKSDMSAYGVPLKLQELIESIYHISDLPQVMRTSALRSHILKSEPGDTITPTILQKLYHLPAVEDSSSPSSSSSSGQKKQAVAQFEEAYYYESDIQNFQANFTHHVAPVAKIIGQNTPDEGYLGEASLDLQYMTTISPLETWVWSQYEFDLGKWAQNVTGTENAPLVHSVSWGSEQSSYSDDKKLRDNTEFMKMGLQGFTVVMASGDDGTGSSGWLFCEKFDPTFPASSPFVTAVGGTYLQKGEEIAWKYSGGGFSNYFSRPKYQDEAVNSYLQNAKGELPNQKLFNVTGRATPDISAFATNYQTVIQKMWGTMSGTSAAAPVFASIFAMINEKREQNGKGPLGFVNPLLYKLKAGVGNDITQGMNQSQSCSQGFKAIKGWDPVTGLGSPNFEVLIKQMVGAQKMQIE